jgi:hypothetical protein
MATPAAIPVTRLDSGCTDADRAWWVVAGFESFRVHTCGVLGVEVVPIGLPRRCLHIGKFLAEYGIEPGDVIMMDQFSIFSHHGP